jgi:8-oxo-dGTP pyrophosphatase MutT (NUDIX family)
VSEIAELYGLDAFRSGQDIHTGKGYPSAQKCKYGDEPATKRVVWADGRAYVPVCDKHLATAKRKLSDVVAVHDIPSPAHSLQVDDHASCEDAGQLYGGAYCLATHKPGVCAGTKRGGAQQQQQQAQPYQRPHVAVPVAPAAKTRQQSDMEQAAQGGYAAAYQHAQQLAQQLGANQGHARVQAAATDYAHALHRHGRAMARADQLHAGLQQRHDSAEARNRAIDQANAARQSAAVTRAAAQAKRQALHKVAARHPRARAHHSIWMGEVALYALGQPFQFALYALVAAAHWGCEVGEFCRNPLHPGPCKGWKHTLHAVAPGAYHAYEKTRVEKLNERRRAKIAALKAQGKPVPKSLLKDITYTAPGASQAQPGFTPPTVQGAKDVVSNIAGKVKTNVPVRAAQLTDQKLAAQAQSLHDVVTAIQGKTNVAPDAVKTALTKIKGKQGPGDKLTDHPEVQKSISALVKNVGDKKGLTDKERGALHTEITNHVEAGTPGVPQGVQDALKRPAVASIPSTAVGAPGSSPISVIQARVALKGLATMPDARRLAAYDNLTKADLAGLTDNEQYLLESDLKGLRGLAGRPGQGSVSQKAAEIHSRLFGTGTGTPAPVSAPGGAAPAHVQHVLATVARTAPGSALSKNHLTAYDKLTKAEFDGLQPSTQAKIRDDLDAARAKFLDPKKKAAADALLTRFEGKTATPATSSPPVSAPNAPAPGTPEAEVADHLAIMADPGASDAAVISAHTQARSTAWGGSDPKALRDQVEQAREKVVADPSRSDRLRTRMMADSPTGHADSALLFGTPGLSDAIFETVHQRRTGVPTSQAVERLFGADHDAVKKLPDFAQRALAEARNDAIRNMHVDSSSDARSRHRTALNLMFGTRGDDRKTYDTLDSHSQRMLQTWAKDERDGKLSAGQVRPALLHQHQYDTMTDAKYSPEAQKLISLASDTTLSGEDKLARTANEFIDKGRNGIEYNRLPEAYRRQIEDTLAHHGTLTSLYPGSSQHARHALAYMLGDLTAYDDRRVTEAVAASSSKVDRPHLDDSQRAAIYKTLSPSDLHKMDVRDKQDVLRDIQIIADNKGGASLSDRYTLQQFHDLESSRQLNSDQKRALFLADPNYAAPARSTIDILDPLTSADYHALPKVYREGIDARVDALSASFPKAYARLKAQFQPSWSPPHAPAAPVTTSARPNVQEVLDTLYGVHPKSHTTAQQLKAYAGIRTAEFQSLQPHEQSTLLGDLSYIVTTSKGGSNAARAQKLIDYFTPPGTPPGQIPNQPAHIPANAVAGQNRYPDPGGRAGMLKQATNKGQSGDGFTRKINGGSGPWGKYGAAGVMLRHVDSSGTERYLMIERGPGISDPGKWQFPGGAIDSLETPHQGATRETTEELGFKAGALDSARVHGEHVFTIQGVVGPKNGEWKYTTIAATVPSQLTPDLSTHHARAETSDAKWMTIDEIRKLDKSGKLLGPLAGGALERNVVSLYPAGTPSVGRPAPVTKKLPRLTGTPSVPKPATPHKPSTGRNLLTDKTAIDKLRQDVKQARKQYDGKTADGRLAAIGAMQGFDDTPTVVSKSEMDRLLATGDYIEVWRGVQGTHGKSAAKINEEMRSGPAYYGKGVFGNGYYLAGQKHVADRYSDNTKNSLLRILIPKAAVIEPHEKMAKEASAIASPRSKAKGGGFEDGTLYDQGRYAAAKGVDGIRIDPVSYGQRSMSSHHVSKKGQEAYNWLNRSVLIIQEAT